LRRACQLFFELRQHGSGDHFAAFTIYRMGDIGIKLLRRVDRHHDLQFGSALIAVRSPKMILIVAPITVPRQFATGHRDKRSTGTIDYFKITDHKAVVERDTTEGP
jgi:hypothetical protein